MTPADSQPGSLSGSQEDLSLHLQHLHINSNSSSRNSPSVDAQDQFRYRYPADPYDGDFTPSDDQQDFDQQQDSIHLNSSNSSTDSMAQANLTQQHCPDHQVPLNHVPSGQDDEEDLAVPTVPRQTRNPDTGRYETYL
jgi:hypothetical protein